MNQLEIDIAEFIINNRDSIRAYLNQETHHLSISEHLFDEIPELYDALLEDYRHSKLISYLSEHFQCSIDILFLIVNRQFVNITLY